MLRLTRSKFRPSGTWTDANFEVFDGELRIGRIVWLGAAQRDQPWMWSITCSWIPLTIGDRGYAASLAAAMAEFKARWEATT